MDQTEKKPNVYPIKECREPVFASKPVLIEPFLCHFSEGE